MSNKINGGPAFPTMDANYEQKYAGEGMTLRDYFAAKALQGYLAGFQTQGFSIQSDMQDQIARGMYSMADAMLDARKL